MSANGLHHSHVSDFVQKITSARILLFYGLSDCLETLLEINRLVEVNFLEINR